MQKSNKQDFSVELFNCQTTIIGNNAIGLSRHEQVCLSGLRFERYFSHHCS